MSISGCASPLIDVDVGVGDLDRVIVRQNSEGEYSGHGGRAHKGLPEEVGTEVAAFWTASQMLDHLGESDASACLVRGVEKVCAEGIVTPDVGGRATTRKVTDAVCEAIRGANG